MARTDNDSWDITESVGATALGIAWARAQESTSECPLYTDPYAQVFIDAAIARGWELPQRHLAERIRSISGYAASRTKWFDEFFIAAGAGGIEQAVILAAGLDARAWRLPWNDGSVVYEIDQPKVLAFKTETLRAHGAQPAARYVPVPSTCGTTGQKRCGRRGSIASEPTAWAAEGLLPYLPADGQDLLFERITDLSAQGSRVAVEAFGAGFFDPEYLASRRERMRQLREAGRRARRRPRRGGLWFIEERTEVTDWFTESRMGGVGDRRRGSDDEIQPGDRRRHHAANDFRRGEIQRLLAGQLKFDERADGLDGFAQRRQPCRDRRRGQHRIAVGLSHRQSGRQLVQPHCRIGRGIGSGEDVARVDVGTAGTGDPLEQRDHPVLDLADGVGADRVAGFVGPQLDRGPRVRVVRLPFHTRIRSASTQFSR